MSIVVLLASHQERLEITTLALLGIGMFVSLIVGRACRILDPDRIDGPQRLSSPEFAAPLAMVLGAGLCIWVMVPALYASLEGHSAATSPANALSPADLAILTIAGPTSALLALLVGDFLFLRRSLRLGLSRLHLRSGLGIGLLGFLFVMAPVMLAAVASAQLLNHFHISHPEKHEILEVLDQTPASWIRICLIAGATVVAPVFEEVLFRGHIQTLVRHLTNRPWLGVLVSSTLFMLVHEPWTWAPIFILALCLGYVYERTGNLWAPIFMHAMFNTFQIIVSLKAGQ